MAAPTTLSPRRRVDGSDPPPRAGRRPWLGLVVAAAPPVILGVMAWQRRWIADDGFINLRVVDQLLHGHGLVFNAGARVEASTSPAWVLLLAATRGVVRVVPLEWIAVGWGLLLSVGALAMGERGAWLLARRSSSGPERPRRLVPVGALVVAALPPFWEFATSGLETALALAWLAGCFWALAALLARAPRRPCRAGVGAAVLAGVGPLIRPDLAIFTVAFLAALLVVDPTRGWRRRAALVAAGLALPVAYEAFRVSYYAALVPNTAIAKEPTMAEWGRGVHYVWDTVGPYRLWLPIAVVVTVGLAPTIRGWCRARSWDRLAVTLAPVVGAALSTLYVVRLGGDFMHARFLLVPLFALVLPVAVVPIRSGPRRDPRAAMAVIVAGWAVLCATSFRVPYAVNGPGPISNEREGTVLLTRHRNPVSIADYTRYGWARYGAEARRLAARGRRVFWVVPSRGYRHELRLPLGRRVGAPVVVAYPFVGQLSYAAGPDVDVLDLLGLGDAEGSHVRVARFAQPGHNKFLDPAWGIARFVDASTPIPDRGLAARAADARAALRCGRLAELARDTGGSPTLAGLARDVADSWALTRFRYAPDPHAARRELCGSAAAAPVTRRATAPHARP
ncbi:MAG TPA: hypothetical protein VG869_01685 [Acidimicrobiia bacterium]|nr:hypothetical protein [Acidimicrobiia bacterium]